jgi:hypothetical protein
MTMTMFEIRGSSLIIIVLMVGESHFEPNILGTLFVSKCRWMAY